MSRPNIEQSPNITVSQFLETFKAIMAFVLQKKAFLVCKT